MRWFRIKTFKVPGWWAMLQSIAGWPQLDPGKLLWWILVTPTPSLWSLSVGLKFARNIGKYFVMWWWVETKLWRSASAACRLGGLNSKIFVPFSSKSPSGSKEGFKLQRLRSWGATHRDKFPSKKKHRTNKENNKNALCFRKIWTFLVLCKMNCIFSPFGESVKVFISCHLYQWYFGICQKIWGIFELLGTFDA